MKFKSIFLGMLGAAALVSCNNESVINPDGQDGDNGYLGESSYATFDLNFNNAATTYAGGAEITADAQEKAVTDAAMYVYKWDGANTTAEAMAYVADADLGSPKQITMMVKSGKKKIYMAVNVGTTANPLVDNNSGTFTYTAKPDTGIAYTNQFTALNWVLNSAVAGFTTTPALTLGNTEGNGNGLIQTLAGGAFGLANGVLYSTTTYPTAARCFMTNWDGPDDKDTLGTFIYKSTCLFDGIQAPELKPNISAATSKVNGNDNHVVLNVQRAFAKISVRITANGATPSTTPTFPYESSENDGSKGRFTPWGAGGAYATSATNVVWALGGINKHEYPFQSFGGTNNAVASPNYALSTGDTIFSATPATSDKWYDSYDNTRVFGTGKKYYTAANTVLNVKTSMTTAANCLALSTADGALTSMKMAMCTENGTEYPQLHDRGTFVIVGGKYAPQNVITAIYQAEVTTNPAEKVWNGNAYTPTPGTSTPNTGLGVNTYYNITYGAVGSGTDTLYYLVSNKVFIWGSDNLKKYYAWEQHLDKDNTAPQTTPNQATVDAINAAKAAKTLLAYSQGDCFYRIWVRDNSSKKSSSYEDEVLVRRNHVYDVNINKIKGPGIADPNQIIVPGTPIPEMDTFVTAEINILDWHKVSQDQEVSYE